MTDNHLLFLLAVSAVLTGMLLLTLADALVMRRRKRRTP